MFCLELTYPFSLKDIRIVGNGNEDICLVVGFFEKKGEANTHLCPQNLYSLGVQCCVTPS